MTTTSTSVHNLPLTPKQDAFARLLFQGLSQREAYLKAGYSSNQLPDTIDRAAWTLASSHKIYSRLQELQAKAESDAVMTVQERKARLSEVGRANLTDFVDSEGNIVLKPSAALAEFVVEEQVVDQETALSRRTKRLKLRDPIVAIDSLNKMERIGAQDSTIINFNEIKILIAREAPKVLSPEEE